MTKDELKTALGKFVDSLPDDLHLQYDQGAGFDYDGYSERVIRLQSPTQEMFYASIRICHQKQEN